MGVRAVGLNWRSALYEEFLHAINRLSFKAQARVHGGRWATRGLDARRKPAICINPLAAVCKDLPQNCYRSDQIDPLGPTDHYGLSHAPTTSTLESVLLKIYEKLR